jgi:hypothetical protein
MRDKEIKGWESTLKNSAWDYLFENEPSWNSRVRDFYGGSFLV